MKNIWIEKRNKSLEEFKFLNAGLCGYVFEVNHPTEKQFNPVTFEMTPMTTRIVIYRATLNVRVVWGMTKEHSKYVKETAELFRSELVGIAKEHEGNYLKVWKLKKLYENNRKRN